MALSQAALQKKKQKKQQKRKTTIANKNQKMIILEQTPFLQRGEIYQCWRMTKEPNEGIEQIIISRYIPTTDSVVVVGFLVDSYCLGVKNIFIREEDKYSFNDLLRKLSSAFDGEMRLVSSELAKKYILSAVEYAKSLGINPYHEYASAKMVFADVNASACNEAFVFGKDGKPLLIGGPNDSEKQLKLWLKALEQSCEIGGFDYILPVGGNSNYFE
jgi:hypothetical protein